MHFAVNLVTPIVVVSLAPPVGVVVPLVTIQNKRNGDYKMVLEYDVPNKWDNKTHKTNREKRNQQRVAPGL